MSEFRMRTKGGDIYGCDACRMEVPVAPYDSSPFQRPKPEDGKNWFCEVCATTFSGNSYVYPEQYPHELMQHIAACTNIILMELRKSPPQPPTGKGE